WCSSCRWLSWSGSGSDDHCPAGGPRFSLPWLPVFYILSVTRNTVASGKDTRKDTRCPTLVGNLLGRCWGDVGRMSDMCRTPFQSGLFHSFSAKGRGLISYL